MKRRFLSRPVLATLLLVAPPLLHAQDGVQGAIEKINRISAFGGPVSSLHGPTLSVADFDGDDKPDGAILLESDALRGNFEVELHFTDHGNADIRFQSPEVAITVEALDIDHDGDIDLVIEQSLTRKRLQVWINDGHGNFEKGRMEDYPAAGTPTHEQVKTADRLDESGVSLPTQRGFEGMLMACHIAGRPPSEAGSAVLPTNPFQPIHPSSSILCRAPPIS